MSVFKKNYFVWATIAEIGLLFGQLLQKLGNYCRNWATIAEIGLLLFQHMWPVLPKKPIGAKITTQESDLQVNYFYLRLYTRKLRSEMLYKISGHHSSVVLSVPTILRPRVRIPSTPSMLFFNLYRWNCIWNEKRTKINKKRPGLAHK